MTSRPSLGIQLHNESEQIRIERGVRRGDTISPKLLTAQLESLFIMLNWQNKGVKINEEFLTNLRFLTACYYAQIGPYTIITTTYANIPIRLK